MKSTVVMLFLSWSAFGQTPPPSQTAPGNKTDDQQSSTAVPKTNRSKKKTAPSTDPAMPNTPKTPTTPSAPRTPVKPADPTQPTAVPHLI